LLEGAVTGPRRIQPIAEKSLTEGNFISNTAIARFRMEELLELTCLVEDSLESSLQPRNALYHGYGKVGSPGAGLHRQ
jgi:hypothetical protein